MDPRAPLLKRVRYLGGSVAELALPLVGVVHLVRSQVPVPKAYATSLRGLGDALQGMLQLALPPVIRGDVEAHANEAILHRTADHVQHLPRARKRRLPVLGQAGRHDLLDQGQKGAHRVGAGENLLGGLADDVLEVTPPDVQRHGVGVHQTPCRDRAPLVTNDLPDMHLHRRVFEKASIQDVTRCPQASFDKDAWRRR